MPQRLWSSRRPVARSPATRFLGGVEGAGPGGTSALKVTRTRSAGGGAAGGSAGSSVWSRFARRMGGGLAGSPGAAWSAESEGGLQGSGPRPGQSPARTGSCSSQLPPPWLGRPGFIHSRPGDSELGPFGATAQIPARRSPPPPLHFADWEDRGSDSRPRSPRRSGARLASPAFLPPGAHPRPLSGLPHGGVGVGAASGSGAKSSWRRW